MSRGLTPAEQRKALREEPVKSQGRYIYDGFRDEAVSRRLWQISAEEPHVTFDGENAVLAGSAGGTMADTGEMGSIISGKYGVLEIRARLPPPAVGGGTILFMGLESGYMTENVDDGEYPMILWNINDNTFRVLVYIKQALGITWTQNLTWLADYKDNYHYYTIIWSRAEVKFYIDTTLVATCPFAPDEPLWIDLDNDNRVTNDALTIDHVRFGDLAFERHNFGDNRVFDTEEIRDQLDHIGELTPFEGFTQLNLMARNTLDQAVTVEVQGSYDYNFTDVFVVGTFTLPIGSVTTQHDYYIVNDYFPCFRCVASCSADPTTGQLDIWAAKVRASSS